MYPKAQVNRYQFEDPNVKLDMLHGKIRRLEEQLRVQTHSIRAPVCTIFVHFDSWQAEELVSRQQQEMDQLKTKLVNLEKIVQGRGTPTASSTVPSGQIPSDISVY